MYKIRKITTIEEFETLEQSWNSTLSKCADKHVQLRFEWCRLWLNVFGKEMKLFVLILEDKEELIGIAPLVIRKVGAFINNTLKYRQMVFIGSGFTDRSDFIITQDNEKVVEQIWNYIFESRGEWDEIHLGQINTDTTNFKFFEKLSGLNSSYVTTFEPSIKTPYLSIEGDFDTYLKGRAKLFRKQLRMYRNNLLSRGGKLEFEVVNEVKDEHINQIIKLAEYRKQLFERRNIFLEDKKFEFIKKMIPVFNKEKFLILFILWYDGVILSYDFTFQYNNTIYDWNTSFNPDYKKYSPGRLLNKHIIEYCFNNDIATYDLMAGDEDYKLKWTKEFSENYCLKIRKKILRTSIAKSYKDFKKLVNKN